MIDLINKEYQCINVVNDFVLDGCKVDLENVSNIVKKHWGILEADFKCLKMAGCEYFLRTNT